MRLVEFNDGGDFSLTQDFIGDVPRYAILSHTWGMDTEEVTYRDLMDGTGKDKLGYDKIRFCGEQAAHDDLRYFWVDTCCIDKSDAKELQTAINSMFRWYKNAAKCYVYLSDVSTTGQKESDRLSEYTWESTFRSSRWFTRGWTLQELLAPSSVEFFSADRELLGDKKSLEPLIHEITGVPVEILQGYDLARFSFDERVSWTMKRQTKCEEDMIYSLLGIFGVSLILNYGEGRDNALQRLRDKADIHQRFILGSLQFVDNAAFDSHEEEHNARCYQGTRVELLRQIDTWAEHSKNECMFWLSGMAGTGKSTISRTVAQNFANKRELGASFFFKRGEGDRGHAGMFITTIVTQLIQKFPSLALPVRNAIEADPGISRKALKQQFDMLISEPLSKIQTDPQKSSTIVIVVDALDECDREEDIGIIIHALSQVKPIPSIRLRFFITSRPELPIRLGFEDINGRYDRLALQQIPKPIIKEDISAFLEQELAMIRDKYNKSVPTHRKLPIDWPGQTHVQSLVRMAVPLFIFASTICRFINDRKVGQPKDQLAKILKLEAKSQASKLDATYLPVLNQLIVRANESEKRDIIEEFTQVVGSIVILANPLSATSLDLLLRVPEGTVESRTDLLHSVLSIPSNPNQPIRLLHLSFRDFLVDIEKRETNPFWIDEKDGHAKLADRCLQLLSTNENLKKDICNLQTPEKPRADVDKQTIDLHLPPEIQYACRYWVYHLKEGGSVIYDDEQVHNFLKNHFLHWLEALSFIGRLRESIGMIENLVGITQSSQSVKLSRFLHDAKRFILNYCSIVDSSPLQLYSAALIFSPKQNIIRNTFQNYIPQWIIQEPIVELDWNAVLQTLEGHSSWVNSVAFSHDSKLLASGSYDDTIKIWDTATGTLQQTLEGHSGSVNSVAFSHDSKLLASGSYDDTIKIWDAATGTLQQTLEGRSGWVRSVAFSHDSKLLASGSEDATIKIWDAATGTLQETLEGHSGWVNSVAFSHDSKLLASGSDDATIKIWDAATGTLQQTAMVNNLITSLVFDSTNSTVITDIGHIKVDGTKSNLCEVSQRPDSQSNCQSISISGPWIIWNTQNLLWIPTDYRPGSVNISPSGSIVAIGCASGRVFVIEFSLALLPALNN